MLAGHRALGAWIAQAMGAGAAEVLAAEKLSGGAIQENWLLDLSMDGRSRALVLRRDAPAGVAESRTRAEEFALLRAAHDAGVTVPRPVAFCAEAGLIGAPFALVEKVEGVAYGPRVVKDESLGGDRVALVAALGRELARIHAIAPGPGLAAALGPKPADPGRAEIAALRGALDALGLERPDLEWPLRWAERHAPAPAAAVLCHRDFRTGNLMLDARGLTGVLDWEFAGWSDPAADLGWFCAECWRFSRPDREAGGLGPREAFYAGYAARGGAAPDPARVAWWELIAHLRWAVIALQQGARHASGREPSLHLALTGRIADELALWALRRTAPEAAA